MLRTGAHMQEAQLVEQTANVTLVILHPEPSPDDPLQINPPPACDAILNRVGTNLDNRGQLL